MRKLQSEKDLLDIDFRKQVIKEISGFENIERKNREQRKHEIYRDQIKKWVVEALVKDGLKADTIQQMQNRSATISICRKVVNKLARCYIGGVKRTTENAPQDSLDKLVTLLEADTRMKKSDRYRQLHKNMVIQVVPEAYDENGDQTKYGMCLRALSPFQYDVIEDPKNPERAKVYILTEFVEGSQFNRSLASQPLQARNGIIPMLQSSNQIDEAIAETGGDVPKERTYIWWSKGYHFTTNDKGEVLASVSPPDLLNPIQVLPFINVADDQDGKFWAVGGDDLIDSSVLVNLLLTDMNAIAYIQGWGQLVVTGKNIPLHLEGGPHKQLTLEQDTGDPTPSANFISANPPLDQWMAMIEQYVAMLLSTNDLSPSAVAGKLDAREVPSGIAMLIEQSEATGNIEDKQKIYKDAERKLWQVVARWQNLYFDRDLLTEEFKQVGKLPEDIKVNVEFHSAKPVVTESEKLTNLKARKDLGINTLLDLVKIDNPGLSDEDAKKKLLEIQTEKLSNMATFMNQAIANAQPQDEPAQEEDTEAEPVEPTEDPTFGDK